MANSSAHLNTSVIWRPCKECDLISVARPGTISNVAARGSWNMRHPPLTLAACELILKVVDGVSRPRAFFAALVQAFCVQERLSEDLPVLVARRLLDDDLLVVVR